MRISMPSMSVARMGMRYLGIYIVERDAVHSMQLTRPIAHSQSPPLGFYVLKNFSYVDFY
jgi:hypothetical protein